MHSIFGTIFVILLHIFYKSSGSLMYRDGLIVILSNVSLYRLIHSKASLFRDFFENENQILTQPLNERNQNYVLT